tara:strand:+ start:6890 stop:7354 length:465 start_codon:yes stop_codon:yes gene_type:complete
MATTVTASSLSVTINESVTLNGVTYGNSVSKQFTSQGEVDQRIMSINAGEGIMTDIFSFSTADGMGIGVAANYAYFRITNLDDTNFVTLQITSGDTYWIKLKAGESFMLMDNEMDAIASSSVFGAFGDVSKVSADADTADVDIEYVVVTAGAAV